MSHSARYRLPIQVMTFPVSLSETSAPEVLLIKRLPSKGGFWQGVTGAPEGEEALEAAALRELFEETGLKASALHPLNYSHSFPVPPEYQHLFHPETKTITEHCFWAEVEKRDAVLSPTEHNAWRWCELEGGKKLLKWPENVHALELVRDRLKSTIR